MMELYSSSLEILQKVQLYQIQFMLRTLPPGWSFSENNVDSDGKLWEGNHEEIDIGDAKEASIDKVKTGQIS